MKKRTRIIYLSIGWFFTALAFAGVFLPVLPTTPFLLVAAWAFGRSSEALHQWLYTHPKFGKYLTDWFEEGAIDRKAKALSFSLMSLSFAFLIYKGHSLYVTIPTGLVMAAVAVYVLSRPDPKRTK